MTDNNFLEGNSNVVHQFGGHGNTYNAAPMATTPQPGTPETGPAFPDSRPRDALYGFADMVGYSRLPNAQLQARSQADLVSILDLSMNEAGVHPGRVAAQDQGDARLLAFPAGTDVPKVLVVMSRVLNDELAARNRDMAEHARMRVRLAFSMGASAPGAAGLVGEAPIEVARMANSELFRRVMRSAPQAQCGLLIDDYLYRQWVRQGFRADISPGDYARARISCPDKGFDEVAWMRLFGYSGRDVAALLAQ
jgi:hypothetical protein